MTNMPMWANASSPKSSSLSRGVQPHQMPGKINTMRASQKLGVASPKMATLRPT